jgi:hypothetical protein
MDTIPKLAGGESSKLRGNFVVLRADSLRLLLPQEDVSSTDYIEGAPLATSITGIFSSAAEADSSRKVLALSGQMTPLATFPGDRFLRTQLADESDVSFAWNEVRVLIGAEFERQALPEVMRGVDAPVDSYVELDGELVFCTSSQRLVSYAISGLS